MMTIKDRHKKAFFRCVIATMMTVLLGVGCSDNTNAASDGGTGDAGTLTCNELLGNESNVNELATVVVIDFFESTTIGPEEIPLMIYIDDCPLFDSSALRNGSYGQGILPGERTLRLEIDDQEIVEQKLSLEKGDVMFLVHRDDSTQLISKKFNPEKEKPDGWMLHLINLTGEDVTISRATDPDGQNYQVVESDLQDGETYSGDLPVFSETGVPIRIENADSILFEGNIGFVLNCDSGDWSGGLTWAIPLMPEYWGNVFSSIDLYPGIPAECS